MSPAPSLTIVHWRVHALSILGAFLWMKCSPHNILQTEGSFLLRSFIRIFSLTSFFFFFERGLNLVFYFVLIILQYPISLISLLPVQCALDLFSPDGGWLYWVVLHRVLHRIIHGLSKRSSIINFAKHTSQNQQNSKPTYQILIRYQELFEK